MSCALRQGAFELFEATDHAFQFFESRFPFLIIGEQFGQIPGIGLSDIFSFWQTLYFGFFDSSCAHCKSPVLSIVDYSGMTRPLWQCS